MQSGTHRRLSSTQHISLSYYSAKYRSCMMDGNIALNLLLKLNRRIRGKNTTTKNTRAEIFQRKL